MKIVFVGSGKQTDPFKIGGIENSVQRLINYLVVERNSVMLLLVSNKQKKIVYDTVNNCKIYSGSKTMLRRLILSQSFDVIIFVETIFQSPIFLIRFLLKKKRDNFQSIKLFYTFPPFKPSLFLQKMKMKLCIDVSIAFSKRIADEIVNQWKGRTKLIYPPVSQEFFLKKIQRNKRKISVGYVGRLSTEKGILLLKDIFEKLGGGDYEFLISGYFKNDEDQKIFKKSFSKLIIPIKINIADIENTNSNVIELLHQLDILILPYQNLSNNTVDTPLLILEGLATGCKVISSNIGTIEYVHPSIQTVNDYWKPDSFVQEIRKTDLTHLSETDFQLFNIENVGKSLVNSFQLKP